MLFWCLFMILGPSHLFMNPWDPLFNPLTKSFNLLLIWTLLPNQPLHFGVNPTFSVISLRWIMLLQIFLTPHLLILNGGSGFLKPLLVEVILQVLDHYWSQPLDYEGILFHCKKWFFIGYLASNLPCHKVSKSFTWWKNYLHGNLMVNVVKVNFDLQTSHLCAIDGMVIPSPPMFPKDLGVASSPILISGLCMPPPVGFVTSKIMGVQLWYLIVLFHGLFLKNLLQLCCWSIFVYW